MEQSNTKIGDVMKKNLDQSQPSIRFSTVWDKHKKSSRKLFGLKKVVAVPLTALVSLMVLLTVGFTFTAIEDNTDYPFVDDPAVIGKWQSVDYVAEIDQFNPSQKTQQGDLFLKELAFIKGGKMLEALSQGNGSLRDLNLSWTQGIAINKHEKTASKYVIKEINGSTYMFYEWKCGDYTYFHMTPQFFVLNKVDNLDYSNYKMAAIDDKVDYPFVDDPQLVGKWECVDYVKTIDKFKPGTSSVLGELFLTQLNIAENGKISALTSESKTPYEKLSWTKGLILDKKDKMASKYEIKELKGDIYLFYEWKSGDYKFGGMQPEYFVLKKLK
ncbi:MAG: hypothetical protein CVU90_03850 [Firmicutes bacterium HGW-Firmicutes-15]|nr:MAG: hypothetical protein CVU90_03850 [Firmicutes bacterium HGW-Firmicutes-15]